MTDIQPTPMFIDPNSGAAPQPGGAVVGGLASQVGEANSKVVEGLEQNPPHSNTEAEIQRQALLAAEQQKADGQPPAEVQTPALATETLESQTPSVESEPEKPQAPAQEPAPAPQKPAEEEKTEAQKATERQAREAAKEERGAEREAAKVEREAGKDRREADREAVKSEREANKPGRRKE